MLQVQLVKAVLPADEFEFDGQTKHVELAEAWPYLPAGHSRHVFLDDDPLTTENLPGTHAIQSANSALLDVSAYFPAGHLRHVFLEDDPVTSEYLPWSHATQSANSSFPDVSVYLPAGHQRQVSSPLHFPDDPFTTEYLPVGHLRHVVSDDEATKS